MYYSHQVLVHTKTGKLAQLNPSDKGSTFNWDRGGRKGTRFKGEDGKVFYAHMDEYTNLVDEWGKPWSGSFKESRAMLDKNKAKARRDAIALIHKDETAFFDLIVEYALNPRDHSFENAQLCEPHRFSMSAYKCLNSVQFFTPRLGKYYKFKERFIDYLTDHGWDVREVVTAGDSLRGSPLFRHLIANKGDDMIMWDGECHLERVTVKQHIVHRDRLGIPLNHMEKHCVATMTLDGKLTTNKKGK